MSQPKDTELTAEKQLPNGYGRIPDELLPKIRGLSHLEGHVFSMLCILANRKRDPLGQVCLTKTELARQCGITRWSLHRAIEGLERTGVVSPGDTGCHIVRHYLSHEKTPPVSPGDTPSPQAQQSISFTSPSNVSEDVSEDVVDETAQKAPRKRVKPWLYWDDRDRLKAREEDPRCTAFFAKWAELLGSEERIDDETEKAIAWLRENPEKRVKIKSFERFMGKWLGKLVEEE